MQTGDKSDFAQMPVNKTSESSEKKRALSEISAGGEEDEEAEEAAAAAGLPEDIDVGAFIPPEGYAEMEKSKRVEVLMLSAAMTFERFLTKLRETNPDEPEPYVLSWWGPSADLTCDDVWCIMAGVQRLLPNRRVVAQHCYNPLRANDHRSFVIYATPLSAEK